MDKPAIILPSKEGFHGAVEEKLVMLPFSKKSVKQMLFNMDKFFEYRLDEPFLQEVRIEVPGAKNYHVKNGWGHWELKSGEKFDSDVDENNCEELGMEMPIFLAFEYWDPYVVDQEALSIFREDLQSFFTLGVSEGQLNLYKEERLVGSIPKHLLYWLQLYFAETVNESREAFASYATHAPHLAMMELEQGIKLPGGSGPTKDLLKVLDRASLLPLLNSESRVLRMQVLALVGDRAEKKEGRDRKLS